MVTLIRHIFLFGLLWLFDSASAIILESSVESQTSAQSIGAPGKLTNPQLTNKVNIKFLSSLCTPMAYTSYLHSTDDSKFKKRPLQRCTSICEFSQ